MSKKRIFLQNVPGVNGLSNDEGDDAEGDPESKLTFYFAFEFLSFLDVAQ